MTVRADPLAARLAIVGGAGAVGSMLAGLAGTAGDVVTVIDPVAPESGPAGDAPERDVLRGDVTAPAPQVSAALAAADTVVLAVPESVAVAALPVLRRVMRPDALVVETLSVKSRIHRALHDEAPDHPAVGINPMFAPGLGMAGRPVAAVVHRGGAAVDRFLGDVTAWGGRVVRLDAAEHDRVTAATQALTHAVVLAFGLALADSGVGIDELAATAPPPHATLLALLARIGSGVPEVYHDIQAGNPFAGDARKKVAAALTRLSATVEHSDEAEFGQLMADAIAPLGARRDAYRALCADVFERVRDTPTEGGRS